MQEKIIIYLNWFGTVPNPIHNSLPVMITQKTITSCPQTPIIPTRMPLTPETLPTKLLVPPTTSPVRALTLSSILRFDRSITVHQPENTRSSADIDWHPGVSSRRDSPHATFLVPKVDYNDGSNNSAYVTTNTTSQALSCPTPNHGDIRQTCNHCHRHHLNNCHKSYPSQLI